MALVRFIFASVFRCGTPCPRRCAIQQRALCHVRLSGRRSPPPILFVSPAGSGQGFCVNGVCDCSSYISPSGGLCEFTEFEVFAPEFIGFPIVRPQ